MKTSEIEKEPRPNKFFCALHDMTYTYTGENNTYGILAHVAPNTGPYDQPQTGPAQKLAKILSTWRLGGCRASPLYPRA